MKTTLNLSAALSLLAGDYISALSDKNISNQPLVYSYALFLSGQFEPALEMLEQNDSIRANWLKELINLMVQGKMESPTYFEIRNFLELDIDLFIASKKVNYLEKLLAYSGILTEINKETYKLIGRVLFNNGLYSLSKYYLDLYKNRVYYDPELHFIYAKYYMEYKDYKNALTAINLCLNALPEYYPAKLLKTEILRLSGAL